MKKQLETLIIGKGITFTPAKAKTAREIRDLLYKWIVITDSYGEGAYVVKYNGGDPENYLDDEGEDILGLYSTEEAARQAMYEFLNTVQYWIVVCNQAEGICYYTGYTGGYYQEYTGAHATVVAECMTEDEAKAEVQSILDSWHCWLLVEDGPAGTAYVCEYTGGPRSEYADCHSYISEYPTEEAANQALADFYESMHCWLVVDHAPEGYARMCECTGGTYASYALGGDYSVYTDENEARSAYERLCAYYEEMRESRRAG